MTLKEPYNIELFPTDKAEESNNEDLSTRLSNDDTNIITHTIYKKMKNRLKKKTEQISPQKPSKIFLVFRVLTFLLTVFFIYFLFVQE